jgi:aerobic-type carbon monoxide dehydrogenase small subunit (CoxS/CutS family)
MITLEVNGARAEVDVPPDVPLLWVLREELGLTGTKFGCGMALCGACTVHLDGQAVRSCVLPVGEAAGRSVRTIEGLPAAMAATLARTLPAALSEGASGAPAEPGVVSGALHPVQQAWIAENVPQCGYCQIGQIMAASALLAAMPRPTDADIDAAMSANLCRCGTYQRIRKAIHRAADLLAGGEGSVALRGSEQP